MESSGCECDGLGLNGFVSMGDHVDFFHTLQLVRERGSPQWWLSAYKCAACERGWLVACEERHNGLYILRTLNKFELDQIQNAGVWPDDFDRFETLLKIGRDTGHQFSFLNVEDSPMMHTIVELAKERPGISTTDLASLLNITSTVATELARKVVSGKPCLCFVCQTGRVLAERGSVVVRFDEE